MGTIVLTYKYLFLYLYTKINQYVVSTPRCNKDKSCRQNSTTAESYKYEPRFLLLWETTAYIKSPSHDRIHYLDVCLYLDLWLDWCVWCHHGEMLRKPNLEMLSFDSYRGIMQNNITFIPPFKRLYVFETLMS